MCFTGSLFVTSSQQQQAEVATIKYIQLSVFSIQYALTQTLKRADTYILLSMYAHMNKYSTV